MIAVILRKAGLFAFSDRDVLKHLFVGPVPNETPDSCAIFCVFDEIARNENHLRKFFKVAIRSQGYGIMCGTGKTKADNDADQFL